MSIVNYLQETDMIKSLDLSEYFYVHCKLPYYIINTCILYIKYVIFYLV